MEGEKEREREGKKLAFNKQDNGCHTPLLTPALPAVPPSLVLSPPSPSPRTLCPSHFILCVCVYLCVFPV